MTLPLTPAQFAALKAAIEVDSSVTLAAQAGNVNAGTLTTPDAVLAYTYDGQGILTVVVTKRRSLAAKLAPEAMIEKHIADEFNDYIQGDTQ